MAEYLNVDPTLVRALWVLAALFTGGLMVLGYILLAFITPEAPYGYPYWTAPTNPADPTAPPAPAGQGWTTPAGGQAQYQAQYQAPPAGYATSANPAWSPDWAAQAAAERQARELARGRGPGAAVVVGTVLIVLGGIALANSMLPGWASAQFVWPALIVALGAGLLVASTRRREAPRVPTAAELAGTPVTAQAAPVAPAAAQAAPVAQGAEAGAGYDAEATAAIDLGAAEPIDPQREAEPK
jgi:hypothetical protein